MREGAAYALRTVFPYIPDKKQAWEDLHRLTGDYNSDVRWNTTGSLGDAFPHIPDKKAVWEDLHRLTCDGDCDVRWSAAYVLGTVFPHIPDKKQAQEDLIRLAQDEDIKVRASAQYSLGRISIIKAANADNEEKYRKELEKALGFLESSANEAGKTFIDTSQVGEMIAIRELEKVVETFQYSYFNPAKFCLPFYRSVYTIMFKNENAESEVQRYLAEAKSAVEGSEGKAKLLEAVENLANALREAHSAQEMDFNSMKCDLNAYRRYCERAADLLDVTEGKAPAATKLIKRGLPIIDQQIKDILAEIQCTITSTFLAYNRHHYLEYIPSISIS